MTNEEFLRSISLDGEEWRDVVGYEGLYVVSSHGRVVVLERPTRRGKGIYRRPPILLKSKMSGSERSYPTVCLWKDGEYITRTIHKLTAVAFLPNPHAFPIVDHIDGNPTNNHISNLRWTTQTENMNNPISIERNRQSQLATPNKRRTPVVCLKDGAAVKIYSSMYEAQMDGFNDSCIDGVIRGLHSHHKGYQWMRLSDYGNLNINNVKEL